jgi:hypothetical protein
MRSVMRKKMHWAPLMGGATLMCAALMNSAHAAVFLVEIQGTVNSNNGFPGITVPPPLPLALSFYIDDAAKSCAPNCVTQIPLIGGGVVYGYSFQTISGFPTITIGQENFPPPPFAGPFGANIVFNQLLSAGVSPLLSMVLVAGGGPPLGSDLQFGIPAPSILQNGFPPPPQSLLLLKVEVTQTASGQFAVRVIGFAGTPGSTQCHGSSTAALAHKYGSMPQAAVALGYSSVKALQADITLFCGS